MRRRRQGRNVNGILLLDKSGGTTSNGALQEVKRLFEARKAGHTGSLDPLAEGLLPICFGEATKVSAFLLDADKRYWVRVRLGVNTSTGDSEGEVLQETEVEPLTEEQMQSVLRRFEGRIEQLPPMYSAVKHKGERLYKLARQGLEVEREPRAVVIHSLKLLSFASPELEIDVHCSKGTYIRTLAEDIGRELGCGAHVTALRRTAVGPYGEEGMYRLDELRRRREEGGLEALDALLLPIESALHNWPEVRLSGDTAYYLQMGQPVVVPKAPTAGYVRLYSNDAVFLGVGQIQEDGRVAPRRLMHSSE